MTDSALLERTDLGTVLDEELKDRAEREAAKRENAK